MTDHSAALLDEEQRATAVQIGELIRDGEVAPLVGAGMSRQSNIPPWSELVLNLLLLWQRFDTSDAASSLSPVEYSELVYDVFNRNIMTVTSFIRRMVAKHQSILKDVPSFESLVEQALYQMEGPPDSSITPVPKQTHRHLVSLFFTSPGRIWTTNYDDLLESAAQDAEYSVRVVHPGARRERAGFSIAHLHGFLPAPSRKASYPSAHNSPVVLAEDDFHLISWDDAGWITQEFVNLLDRYRVLILGMSLDDPNLRRVLTLNNSRAINSGEDPSRHFAVIKQDNLGDSARQRWYREYWETHGVELIELPSHEHLLPFLARLRYETYGGEPGLLWKRAAQRVENFVPRHVASLALMYRELNKAIRSLESDFNIPSGEIVEIGIFLIDEDCQTLRLSFRSSEEPEEPPHGRRFSVSPDSPTGTAGRVFVSSDIVRIGTGHSLFDYGLIASERSRGTSYKGLISVPIIDWARGGLPLGVIYLTTSTTEGRVFTLPTNLEAGGGSRTLDDLYTWLHRWSLQTLDSCCRG